MTTPEPPATIQDLMTASGLCRDTVKALIRMGQLPGKKMGRKYVVPKGEFDRWYRGDWEPKPMPELQPKPQETDEDEQPDPIDFLKRRSA